MIAAKFEFDKLQSLLGFLADDPAVIDLIEQDPESILRFSQLGFVEFKTEGVSVMFKEVAPEQSYEEDSQEGPLYLSAFHLHRNGHEGYSQYSGQLPGSVQFDDHEGDVIKKIGPPLASGGGGISTVLKRPVPRWVRYSVTEGVLHFQFDPKGRVELVTLFAPELNAELL